MLAQAGGPIVNLTTTLVNQPVKGMPSGRRPALADWIAASLRTCCTTPFSGLFAIVAVLDCSAGRLFNSTRPVRFGAPGFQIGVSVIEVLQFQERAYGN